VLPPHVAFDHTFDIEAENEPHWEAIFALSREELSVPKKYIKELLHQEMIHPRKSPSGVPILFVPKHHRRGV
jgi:hypothetical protein